jgi:hypothetical protein
MSAEEAEYFVQAWRQGRRYAWRLLQRLTLRLRDSLNDSDEEWRARLHHLELIAGVDTGDVRPTTQAAFLATAAPTLSGELPGSV